MEEVNILAFLQKLALLPLALLKLALFKNSVHKRYRVARRNKYCTGRLLLHPPFRARNLLERFCSTNLFKLVRITVRPFQDGKVYTRNLVQCFTEFDKSFSKI